MNNKNPTIILVDLNVAVNAIKDVEKFLRK